MWFEPERVTQGSWLGENHPEWLLGAKDGRNRLLDLGNPEARQWLTDHIDHLLTRAGNRSVPAGFQYGPAGLLACQ
jgi:alpha-galactosidase